MEEDIPGGEDQTGVLECDRLWRDFERTVWGEGRPSDDALKDATSAVLFGSAQCPRAVMGGV